MGDPLWSNLLLKSVSWKELMMEPLLENCSSWEEQVVVVHKGLYPVGEGPMLEEGKSMERKEQQRCGVMNQLQPLFFICLHH